MKKIIWLILSSLIVLSLILASCGGEDEEPTKEPITGEPVTPKGGGNWWDYFGEPQYGGTITVRLTRDPTNFDPWWGSGTYMMELEQAFSPNWIVDPEINSYKAWWSPIKYRAGWVAESWDQPDPLTVTVHVRKGVLWQDKPPVNGREFTAYDMEYEYQRCLGLGSGYTEVSPYVHYEPWMYLESVTATDKYTVVFKFNQESPDNLSQVTDVLFEANLVPREAVEKWGDVNDWEHVIGTGAFMLENYVSGSVVNLVKNPNYWGYDERHPENKLPYADKLTQLIIPDTSTAVAALRTGKIDMLSGIQWEQAESIMETNPYLMQDLTLSSSSALCFRCDKEPFTDIRVRKAMQMAIDLDTIAKTYYGGLIEGKPFGLVGPYLKGYYTPFDDWPDEVKEGYTYNPEGAKELLAEAGYANGFKTNIITTSRNADILQILQAYFADIGVDMEIKLMEATVASSYIRAGKQDQMAMGEMTASFFSPNKAIAPRWSQSPKNITYNNDPVYDELYLKFCASVEEDERKSFCREADMYDLAHYWGLHLFPLPTYTLYQPWIKGFTGYGSLYQSFYFPRLFIDQDLKKETLGS